MSNRILASCIAASLGSLGTMSGALAQDAMIEGVFVSGSRIERADIDGIGKVDVHGPYRTEHGPVYLRFVGKAVLPERDLHVLNR